jgi:O-antigen/teichoic acid export membrane protein
MINTKSRSHNLIRNVLVSSIAQVVILLVAFVNRTLFIRLLGVEYLGIDGLFTSILIVLSLAELGIGNAIIYNLYKPIATGDTEKSKQYITFYSKAYSVIILLITVAGLCLLPFLKYLINTNELKVNIDLYAVFILFLLNTTSSYFMAHRQAVLVVNQQQSTVSAINMIIKIAALIFECVSLLIFKNYYIYLIIKVAANYIQAVIISIVAKKRYPELCIKSRQKLDRDELSVIKKNVGALVIRRIGSVVLLSTDNLIINKFISIVMVGIYSNYTLIISSIQTVTTKAFSAMTATIGNYVASKSKENVESLFRVYTYTVYLIYGLCSVCLYVLTNRFIILLWGESYLLSKTTLFIIVINFFLYGFQVAINVFRDTTGLFVQGKYRPLISSAINVLFSLIFVKPFGISGVILATVISHVMISSWYDPYILYKHYFVQKVRYYYYRIISYIVLTVGICLLADYISNLLGDGISSFILSMFLCILFSGFLIIPFVNTCETKYLFSYIKQILRFKRG